jgi:TonB family C-terminal domain
MAMTFADHPPSSRRLGGIALVVVLHVGIVYGLLHGLGRQVVEVLRPPIEATLIEEVKPPPKPPPPVLPPKLLAPPPPYLPPPDIQVRQPPPPNAIAAVTREKPPEAPPPVAARAPEPVRVAPVIDAARSCAPPEYPAVSRRLEESGAVVLQFLIGVDGRVADSKVERSSGFARLDEAARAALSRCRFKPGSVDGRPEQSWARLRYVWKIE